MASLEDLFTPDDSPTSFLNPTLMQQQDQLARRRAIMLEQARRSANQIGLHATPTAPDAQPGFQSAVTGARVLGKQAPVSPLAAAVPLLAQLGDDVKQRLLDKDESGYQRIEQDAAQKHMALQPPDDADPRIQLQWAQRGTQIPSLAPVMQAYVQDGLIKAPERAEARQERIATREQTLADKQERQQQELEYRRQRDAEAAQLRRDLAGDSNSLRRDLAAAVAGHSGGAGGDKASNYQIVTGDDGTITRVNKLTGQSDVVGKGGKSAGFLLKEQGERKEKQDNAKEGLKIIGDMRTSLKTATGSLVGQGRDLAAGALGFTTDGAKAASELDTLSGQLTSMVPRMAGQVSDADLKFLQKQAGDAANRNLPPGARMAALQKVEDKFNRLLSNSPTPGPVDAPSPTKTPTLRESIEQAAGYKPPPSGAVDTSGLEAEYKAERDPNKRALLGQRLQSAGVDPRSLDAAPAKSQSIEDRLKKYR